MKALSVHGSAQRLRQMHDWLAKAYGPQHWWPAETAFEVILGAYLTQNTSWKAVERSLANLRAADVWSIAGLRMVSLEELQELIRPSGFYSRKALALKSFVALLDAEFNGSLDEMAATPTEVLRSLLLDLPGVGYETAMPFCCMRWDTRFRWPMNICGGLQSGMRCLLRHPAGIVRATGAWCS